MDVEQELLPLLKQLAEGVLKQRQIIQDLEGRVARLEYVEQLRINPFGVSKNMETNEITVA